MPTYRYATESDLPAICVLGEEVNAIHHRAFPHIFAGPGPVERDRTHWASSVAGEEAQTFLAEEDGFAVAFVNVVMVNETHTLLQPLRFGRVGSVSVTESMRGQGIGPALMRLAHEWVQARGGHEIRLNVWAFNEHALHVYRELGYEVRSVNLAKVIAQNIQQQPKK